MGQSVDFKYQKEFAIQKIKNLLEQNSFPIKQEKIINNGYGYLNKVVLADDDGYCTSEILPLKFHNIIVPEYARYYMMSPTFLAYADRCSYGVKMPRLGTPDGKKAVFVVPPVDEQKRIAEAIESAFEQLNSIGATLE